MVVGYDSFNSLKIFYGKRSKDLGLGKFLDGF